jgi:thiol-disulfide isomerase/thioredoxin
MTLLVLVLSLAIVFLLAYRFWEPFVSSPKRDVPTGSANLYFFYTDWCGFSKKAMPEWEGLEAKLRETPVFGTTKVTPVRVNADTDRALATLYQVEGYPTIKLETSASLVDYTRKRTTEDLLAFLRETLGQERKSL